MISTQALQRRLRCLHEIRRIRYIRDAGNDADLGGQHHAVAQRGGAAQHITKRGLVGTEAGAAPVEAVHIGRVDQIHTEVKRMLNQRGVGLHIGSREAPTSKRNGTDLCTQGTKLALFAVHKIALDSHGGDVSGAAAFDAVESRGAGKRERTLTVR